MFELSSHRATTRRAALLASVIILCLVIAPVCAPLCAAKLCASVGHDPCHSMTPDDSARTLLSAKNACRGFDSFAVLPRADEQLTASAANRTAPSPLGVGLSGPGLAIALGASPLEGALRSPLRPPGASSQTIVLRV